MAYEYIPGFMLYNKERERQRGDGKTGGEDREGKQETDKAKQHV